MTSFYTLEKLRELQAESLARVRWMDMRDPAATAPPVFGWAFRWTGRSLRAAGLWLETWDEPVVEPEHQPR